MSERDEPQHLTQSGQGAPSGTGWNPEPNPVESFTSSIEQAVRNLSLELAALRAERDGLRLELEGLRAQYDLVRQQLHDRDRFHATIQELGEIVRTLNVPVSWTEAPAAAMPAVPAVEPTVPLSSAPPAPAVPAPAPAPVQQQVAAPPPPAAAVAPDWVLASPQPVAQEPDPFAWAAARPDQPDETDWSTYLGSLQNPVIAAPMAAQPPPPPPSVDPTPTPPPAPEPVAWAVPPAAEPVAPAPVEPEPVATTPPPPPADPDPAPERTEPALRFALPDDRPEQPSEPAPPATGVYSATPFALDGGVWQLPEPEETHRRRLPAMGSWRDVAKKVGSVLAGFLIVAVLLVAIGPKVLPYQTFFVRSGSMEPKIETGELIFLSKVAAADLGTGDIITFERPDRPGVMVTHRIVAVEQTDTGGKVFQTKGDANGSADTWRVPAVGDGWKYAFGIPKLGYVFGYLNTSQARLAMLVVPAVILGLLSLIDIWKPKKKPATATRTASRR